MIGNGVDCERNVKQRAKVVCSRCGGRGFDGYLVGKAIPTVRRCSVCLGKGEVVRNFEETPPHPPGFGR